MNKIRQADMVNLPYLLSPYAIAQISAAVVAVGVAILAYHKRESRGGRPLFYLFFAISVWTIATSLESAAIPQDHKIFWSVIAYLGSQPAPVLILLLAAEYGGYGKRITRLTTAMMFIIPAIVILLAATNGFHGLVWPDFVPGPEGTNSLIYLHGPAYWLSIAYAFTCTALATALILFSAVGSQGLYRKQARYLLMATLFPWVGSAMYLLNLNPFPGLDTISISFLFTGLVMLFVLQRMKLFDMIPIPNELIVEHIDDAVVVIDPNFRIVEINASATALLDLNAEKTLGVPAEKELVFWKDIHPLLNEHSERIEVNLDRTDRMLDVKISPLEDRARRFLGWALIISDISALKDIEKKLQRSNKNLQRRLKEIRELQEQLKEQVIRDSLTGVYNRSYLEETLARELANAERDASPLSILMLDVDKFKRINDKFGHKKGDEVIAALG